MRGCCSNRDHRRGMLTCTGSGGICLLDPTVFNGTGVSRIGITAGKNGKVYVVNADNLGGYRLGTGQQDGVIQVIGEIHMHIHTPRQVHPLRTTVLVRPPENMHRLPFCITFLTTCFRN